MVFFLECGELLQVVAEAAEYVFVWVRRFVVTSWWPELKIFLITANGRSQVLFCGYSFVAHFLSNCYFMTPNVSIHSGIIALAWCSKIASVTVNYFTW